MAKKILIFDTETTSLYEDNLPPGDPDQPGIVQLAAIGLNNELGFNKDMFKFSAILNPFKPSTQGAIKVHGYTNEFVEEHGFNYKESFEYFESIIEEHNLIVGHNIEFDVNVYYSECIRMGMKTCIKEKKTFCTMRSNYDIYQRCLKLGTVYKYYTGHTIQNAHDAYADVEATKLIFIKTLERLKKCQK